MIRRCELIEPTQIEGVAPPPAEDSQLHSALVEKIEGICQHIRAGGMVIMVDDESRENEGDLVMAAEAASPASINFMAKEGRGLICLPMAGDMIERLQLPMMSDHSKNIESRKTAFTVSIEAKAGVSTGISAQDRATTIQVAIHDDTGPGDLVVPGHVFPLKARDGGVLTRAGHTEGSVDLVRLAGCKPASVICEIMNDDGTMARRDDLEVFSQEHNIPIISIEEIITYRMIFDSYVRQIKREMITTSYGDYEAVWFESELDQTQHVAFVKGDDLSRHTTEVRVYRQKFLTDIFGPAELELSETQPRIRRVDYGFEMLARAEHGVYLYLSSPPAAPPGAVADLPGTSPPSSDNELMKVAKMDARLYGIGAQILRKLGVKKLILNTITPRGLIAIGGFGLQVQGVRLLHAGKLQPAATPPAAPPRELRQPDLERQPPPAAPQRGAGSPRIMVLRSGWHPDIVEPLVAGAVATLTAGGVLLEQLTYRTVPGSYELLMGAQVALQQRWEVVLCFGCIIQGKTMHDQWIYDALKHGLAYLQASSQALLMPCVVHVPSKAEAVRRVQVGSPKHRGVEAAQALLAMLAARAAWHDEVAK